jgi:hypothetical protein
MGGLLAPLGEMWAKSLEKEGGIGSKLMSLVGNKEWELDISPEGKAIKAQLGEYQRLRSAALGESTKDSKAVLDWHQGSDATRNTLPLHTATIADLHAHAVKTNHPIQQVTNRIIRRGMNPTTGVSENASLTMAELSVKNRSLARLAGLNGSVGDKMQNVTPLIASLLEHPDPRVQLHGRRVADIVSNEIKDTRTYHEHGGDVTKSSAKVQMNQSINTVNKFRALSEEKQIPKLNVNPTYTPVSNPERTAQEILRLVQIPFVAIPHIGQYFHLGMSAPLQSVGKALLRMNEDEMHSTLEASGILANTQWDVIHSEILARSGKLARWTNQPTAAEILRKTIHQPGFNYMRLKQLSFAASVGFHSAQFWATNALSGDKRALAELAEMGIDIADVQKQGGKLTEEQLTKGVYHFVNNRLFVNKTIDQSLYGNANFFMRSAFMYHSFVSSEAAYIGRELRKQFKAGDVKGIAQFVGTLGIVFPMVAPMLKSLELLARTGSLQQAQASMQKDYKSLMHPDSFGDFTSTYFDMLAHIGAMGAYYNYTQAIKGSRLANAVVGSMIGMGITDISDSVNAMRGKSGKPLGRDLTQMIPVVGKPLSHRLFPTLKEQKEENPRPSRLRRHLSLKGRRNP